jgi:hypothetical protein
LIAVFQGAPSGRRPLTDAEAFDGSSDPTKSVARANKRMKADMSKKELDDRIAILRKNLADLTQQATWASGAAAEERLASLVEDQQAVLNDLLRRRDAMDENTHPEKACSAQHLEKNSGAA